MWRYYTAMSTIQAARTLLRQAESSLRQLIEAALKDQRYVDVAEMAALADGLSRLVDPTSTRPAPEGRLASIPATSRSQSAATSAPKRSKSARKASTKRTGYPRFVREGDRLVKIGWSKKNKSEYEHRVPRSAVDAFLGKLTSAVKPGRVFEVEGLLPVTDQAGEEVPAYQVYVTLAWLREIGVIAKKGRDGYVIEDAEATKSGAQDRWQELPEFAS
jgi:hypothetical protein